MAHSEEKAKRWFLQFPQLELLVIGTMVCLCVGVGIVFSHYQGQVIRKARLDYNRTLTEKVAK